MSARMRAATSKPQILFVDDEQRVLNSMRIMFRRQYDLHLAANGKEALEIVKANDIDVIVADHRMPQMTGVDVLTKVRALSPRTVRILLTGYADLDAVEGSINEGEVFRFLTKPCPPDQLRETLNLAVRVAQHAEAHDATADGEALGSAPPVESTSAGPVHPEARRAVSRERLAQGLGIVVFSADDEVLTTVQQAVRGRLPVYKASNIVQVVKVLTEKRPGVLVTDISNDKATIQAMTARLKVHLPELVTIAVSPHRDVLDMVWLINHGQIFRFLRKPLSAGRCAISLQAALKHHRMLLKNPDLLQRHQVDASDESGMMSGMLAKLRSVRRLWASA
jgi:DNA-binding NtrC family response regulator